MLLLAQCLKWLLQAATPAWLEGAETVLVVVFGVLAAISGLLAARHGEGMWGFMHSRFLWGTWDGLGLTVAVIAVGLTFWGFIEVAELWIGQNSLGALDAAGQGLADDLASPRLDAVMGAVTWLGSGWVAGLVVAAVAITMYRRQAWQALGVLLVGFGAGEALVYALKSLFARVRPTDGIAALGASFPSGHAFTATLTFGMLMYLVATGRLLQRANRMLRIIVCTVLILLIGLVGLSRIYLRAHFVTDVLGGGALAIGWLAAAVAVTRWLLKKGVVSTEPSMPAESNE